MGKHEKPKRPPDPSGRKGWLILGGMAAVLVFAALARYSTMPPPPPIHWQVLDRYEPSSETAFESGWMMKQEVFFVRIGAEKGPARENRIKSYTLTGDFDRILGKVKAEAEKRGGEESIRRPDQEVLYSGDGWSIMVSKGGYSRETNRFDRRLISITTFQSWGPNLAGLGSRVVRSWQK